MQEGFFFLDKTLAAIENFSWTNAVDKLKTDAPFLFSILDGSIKETGLQQHIIIVVCASMIVRSHCERANIFQRLMSVLMYANHVPK